jgi:hypothetical protein
MGGAACRLVGIAHREAESAQGAAQVRKTKPKEVPQVEKKTRGKEIGSGLLHPGTNEIFRVSLTH